MIDSLVAYILDRERDIFDDDFAEHVNSLQEIFSGARVLVVGGAGSIGSHLTYAGLKIRHELMRRKKSRLGCGLVIFLKATLRVKRGSKSFSRNLSRRRKR